MTKLTCFPNKPIASGMKIRFEFLFVKTNFAFILTGYALFGHDFIKFNVFRLLKVCFEVHGK